MVLDTGAVADGMYGYTGNLKFRKTKHSKILSGSLHSYFNGYILGNTLSNSNDFNFYQLYSSIDILEEKLGANFLDSKLTELEFGLNLNVGRPVDEIITCIKLHKELSPFTTYKKSRCSKFF